MKVSQTHCHNSVSEIWGRSCPAAPDGASRLVVVIARIRLPGRVAPDRALPEVAASSVLNAIIELAGA